MVLAILSVVLCCKGIVPQLVYKAFLIITFVYFGLFWLGYFIGIGPLKFIREGILKDHEDELEELGRKKQPWE